MKNVRHKYNAHEVSDQERAATFAARQNILDFILRRLREQTGSSLLLTGPRGAGKSTLVQMVRQEIEESENLSQNWLPVILPEELIGVTSLRDFLSCILEQLGLTGFTTGEKFHNQCEDEFDEESSEALAIEGIKTVAKETNKTLLVAVENLDQLFSRALDDERMQATLRRLLMHEKQMCLLATSVSILGNQQEYDHPFWEYFEEIQLLPANDVETDEILKLRANYEQNDAFLNRYTQSHGLVRAINRLTGGNPRLIVMLYEVITMGDVESAVAVLRQLLDELTPLYNGLLDRLSNQHRKIVDAIMRQGGQAFVYEIAATARLPENTIRAQLKRLKDTGCVNVIGGGKGKEAVYTVEDRLFSTWYQLRYFRPQRRRIEIFIEVLRVWFSAEERQRQLSEIFKRQEMSNDVIQPELSRYLLDSLEGTEYYAKNHERWKSYYATSSNFKNADDPDTEFVPGEKISTPLSRAYSLGENEESQQEIDEYTRIINLAETSADQVAQALIGRGVSYGQRGEFQQEIEDYTRVIDLTEAPTELIAKALAFRGVSYGQIGEPQQEIEDYTRVINLPEAPTELIAQALFNRGVTYGELGETQQEIEDYKRVINLPEAPTELIAQALFNRGVTYGQLGESQQAIEDYTHVINLPEAPPEEIAQALFNRGLTCEQKGESQQAIEDYTRVINSPEAPPKLIAKALVNRGVTYGRRGESQQAIEDYTRVINSPEAPPDQVAKALFNRGVTYGQLGEPQQAVKEYTHVINLPKVPTELIAQALFNRGVTYGQLGESQQAIEDYTHVINLREAPTEQIAQALVNRGYVYGELGVHQQEIEDYTRVIDLPEAPPDQVARALVGRSHRYNLLFDSEKALSDTHKIAQISATSDEVKSMGAVNQGTALAHRKLWEESFSSYHSAISDFEYRVEHRKMLAADIILESSHFTLIAANPDFVERVLKFSIDSFPVQNGKEAIELLQNLAKPAMKHRWSHVFRFLKESIPEKDYPSLEILAPVAEILDGAPTTNMIRLPLEQRNFVNEVLRRFETDSK